MEALALQVEHRVDHVLEHARPGDRALLGDVPDQEDRTCRCSWRSACSAQRALAHLADAARPATRARRVDASGSSRRRRSAAAQLGDVVEDRLEVASRPGRRAARVEPEPVGPQLDLLGRLLARDVEDRPTASQRHAPRPAAAASTCRSRGRRRSGRASPGTIPPPSTRLNSPIGTCMRAWRCGAIGAERLRRRRGQPPPVAGRGADRARRRRRRRVDASRPACSRPRSPGSAPSSAASGRRRPGRRRRSVPAPWNSRSDRQPKRRRREHPDGWPAPVARCEALRRSRPRPGPSRSSSAGGFGIEPDLARRRSSATTVSPGSNLPCSSALGQRVLDQVRGSPGAAAGRRTAGRSPCPPGSPWPPR